MPATTTSTEEVPAANPAQEYLDLVESAVTEAEKQIGKEIAKRLAAEGAVVDRNDPAFKLRLRAEIHNRATQNLALQYGNLTQALVHEMWEMRCENLYQALNNEWTSFWEYCEFSLSDSLEEKYLKALVNSVEVILVDVDANPVIDEETGEIIGPEQIIQNSLISGFKEMAYSYSIGTPEQKADIVKALASGASRSKLRKLRGDVTGSTNLLDAIEMAIEYQADGSIKATAIVNDKQVNFMESMLGSMLKPRFVNRPVQEVQG
jgi:hypothetical protein